MAAKRHAELIPLCHPIALTSVKVEIAADESDNALVVTARAKTTGQTGVEMEALTAVSVACLTIYDMLKASDRAMVIEGITLLEKSGGASGDYRVPLAGYRREGLALPGRWHERKSCQARSSRLMSVTEARAAMLAAVHPLTAESVPLQSALGRVLAQDRRRQPGSAAFCRFRHGWLCRAQRRHAGHFAVDRRICRRARF